jgi:hypothetical protein
MLPLLRITTEKVTLETTMQNTIGAIVLAGAILVTPFAIALVAVAANHAAPAGVRADAQGEFIYDYPTSMWADH